jgi:hypothetical protein
VKFNGELKFPEIDHPGVPVTFVVEGTLAELVVDGESLGRWSLYDIHARRLVASAFQIDLDGAEITFIADDPVDFAYRGVEHMAETWAGIKSKRIANRALAVRKSRRGTTPSRLADMRAAMEANLEAQSAPRQIAGEQGTAQPPTGESLTAPSTPGGSDWDLRDQAGAIPLVGSEPTPPPVPAPSHDPQLSEEARLIEEEKQRIADEWSKLEEERRRAEQQEANRIEAFRLEMQRLEAERAELRRQAAELVDGGDEEDLPHPESQVVQPQPEPQPESEPQPEPQPEPMATERPPAEPPVDEGWTEPEHVFADEPTGVLDLSGLEEPAPAPEPEPSASPSLTSVNRVEPEPALTGAGKDRSGLMGAVRAAFKSGPKDHDHQFIEAPGGIGITRYVCEECGYVSISAGGASLGSATAPSALAGLVAEEPQGDNEPNRPPNQQRDERASRETGQVGVEGADGGGGERFEGEQTRDRLQPLRGVVEREEDTGDESEGQDHEVGDRRRRSSRWGDRGDGQPQSAERACTENEEQGEHRHGTPDDLDVEEEPPDQEHECHRKQPHQCRRGDPPPEMRRHRKRGARDPLQDPLVTRHRGVDGQVGEGGGHHPEDCQGRCYVLGGRCRGAGIVGDEEVDHHQEHQWEDQREERGYRCPEEDPGLQPGLGEEEVSPTHLLHLPPGAGRPLPA